MRPVLPLLTPEFLRKIDRLHIRSQHVFRGKFKGERQSLNRGVGTAFADYRVYEPGDDLRYVDWNVYARLDRLFIKLFSAEEDLPIYILLDKSKSMGFGEPTKLEYAKQIAAAFGYIALASFDRVAVYTISSQLQMVMPATYGRLQFAKLSQAIEAVNCDGETHLASCLRRFVTQTRQRGVAILISDFLDTDGYAPAMKPLLARGFDVTLVHVLSDEERHPQFSGELRLTDAETGQAKEITVNEQALVSYAKRFDTFCENLRRYCLNRRIHYVRITNRDAVEQFILKDLRRSGMLV